MPGISDDIGDLILTIEGFDNHISALSKTSIKEMMDDTNKVIAIFAGIDEKINSERELNDAETVERFKYALKALYKLKSLLHIAYTRNVPVMKTPDSTREALSAISRAAVLHGLSKNIR